MGREADHSHTSNAVYLTAFFTLCCVGYDSTHVSAQGGWWAPPGGRSGGRRLPGCRQPPHPAFFLCCRTSSSGRTSTRSGFTCSVRPLEGCLPAPATEAPPPLGPHRSPLPPAPAGATCLFAYLYVRPLIRRRLGSASRAYINYSTIYICWLLLAVFYHLPSLESLGGWVGGWLGWAG